MELEKDDLPDGMIEAIERCQFNIEVSDIVGYETEFNETETWHGRFGPIQGRSGYWTYRIQLSDGTGVVLDGPGATHVHGGSGKDDEDTVDQLYLDWEDGPFDGAYDCPECNEPFYRDEWDSHVFGDRSGAVTHYECPVCEEDTISIYT